MALERVWKGLLVVAALSIVAVLLVQAGLVSPPWSAEEGKARIVGNETDGESGDPKAVVDVEVADTRGERYTGLSEHESLEPGNGMLFVFPEEENHTFVMREMDFGIDIIYIDANGTITSIHHARAPGPNEDGNDLRYPGRGKWVLEVPRGYANETGIEVGDEVRIDLESNRTIITGIESGALEPFTSVPAPGADTEAESVSIRR